MEAKRGDRVSLNTVRRIFFFQTVGGISLNSETQISDLIPETATDEHLKQINFAIGNEHLILGHPEATAEMPDKKNDILSMLALGRNKIADWVGRIRSDRKIPSSERMKVIETLIELEKAGKNRKSVIQDAESALKYIGGISEVVETEKEKLEIKLTSGAD